MRPGPLTFALLPALSGCSPSGASDDRTFTLYRNSVTDPSMRIHVATFDATEKEEYNRENCDTAAKLFGAQPGVKTKFWCEKGRFRKWPCWLTARCWPTPTPRRYALNAVRQNADVRLLWYVTALLGVQGSSALCVPLVARRNCGIRVPRNRSFWVHRKPRHADRYDRHSGPSYGCCLGPSLRWLVVWTVARYAPFEQLASPARSFT